MASETTHNWRPAILVGITLAVILQIVALSPAPLEQADPDQALKPEILVNDANSEVTLATKVPKGKIPDYTVEGFQFASTHAGAKQWKLDAKRAFLYNTAKLVHARQITAYLYDNEDKITIVTGDEAQYFMDQRDLEVFGNVKTTFPDGFQTESEYLRYLPAARKIEIPKKYKVVGQGTEKDGQEFSFSSEGLDFEMDQSTILLPAAVHFTLRRKSTTKGKADETKISSDRCVIDRSKQLAHFTMYPERDLDDRFVHINQPSLFARGRRVDVSYGSFDKILQYMTAYDDVLIRETVDGSTRYGTGGRADFDTRRDIIVLKEFPQVYQDNDTVTGEVIVVHRDTDIVEVEHSNAYSEGAAAAAPQPTE